MSRETIEEKYERAESIEPMWERVAIFTWGEMLELKKDRKRADKLQAQLDAVRRLQRYAVDQITHLTERIAELEAPTLCNVCLGKPLASGAECICEGAGTEAAEIVGLRKCADKLQARLDTVEKLHTEAVEQNRFIWSAELGKALKL
jgi:hypothetical protein